MITLIAQPEEPATAVRGLSKFQALVTGGLGFIGSNLAIKLSARGHDVTVFDNFSNGTGRASVQNNRSIEIVKGDILNPKSLEHAVKSAEIVFNLAVRCLPESIENPVDTHMVNDVGTLNLCMACKKYSTKLIHISSSEAYGTAQYTPMDETHPLEPTTPYGASKAASEMIVSGFAKCYNMQAVVIRPFNAYGPFMREDSYSAVLPRFVSRAKNNKRLVIFGDGLQTRDFTYVDDITEGIAKAGEVFPSGQTMNIARGKEVRIVDLARIVIDHYQKQGDFDLDDPIEFKPPRQGDVRRHFADIKKARKLLGYSAKIDIRTGVKKYASWFEDTHPSH